MKKYSIYLLAAAAALVSAACGSGSDSVDTPSEVTFTTEVTRVGALTELPDGAQMNVYLAKGTTLSRTDEMRKAVRTGGVWKGQPSITLQPEEELRLFAVYPYEQSAADATIYPVTVASQTDYLYSGAGAVVTYQKPSTSVKMRHAMAMLALDIRSYVGGRLKSIAIDDPAFPTEGTLRISNGRITATKFGAYTHACDVALSEKGGTGDAASFFVIPFTAGADMRMTLTIDGKPYVCTLPATAFDRSSKYLLHLNLTEAGLSLLADQTEVISLDEPGAGQQTEKYGLLRVTHNAETFAAPLVQGTGLYGQVYWGDDTSGAYEAGRSIHTYSSVGTHIVSIDLWNAESVQFESLAGVSEIDLSKF